MQTKVNATTLDELYQQLAEIKHDNADDFTVGWLADGIHYGSANGRMSQAAELALVNMSTEDIAELIGEAIWSNETMGSMARYCNQRFTERS
jgi:hypothetical protein